MCEFLRHDANKWTAILHLAELWGIEPGAICAVGDDVNDIPMIKNAGLGVAMGHARLEVRGAADLVTGDHDEDGVAMLVDQVLLGWKRNTCADDENRHRLRTFMDQRRQRRTRPNAGGDLAVSPAARTVPVAKKRQDP